MLEELICCSTIEAHVIIYSVMSRDIYHGTLNSVIALCTYSAWLRAFVVARLLCGSPHQGKWNTRPLPIRVLKHNIFMLVTITFILVQNVKFEENMANS